MTPEKCANAIVPGSDDSDESRKKKVKFPNPMTTEIQEYQCIVCKFVRTSPTEMHHHQTHCHTSEELSLSIIGLQLLFNMQKFSKVGSTNQVTTSDLDNFLVNQKSNISKIDQPIYPEIQQEPMCLKTSPSNSLSSANNLQVENPGLDMKTVLQMNNNEFFKSNNGSREEPKPAPKEIRPKTPSAKTKSPTPLSQRKYKKVVPILPKSNEPEILSVVDMNFPGVKVIPGDLKNFVQVDASTIIQSVNISEKTSVRYEGNHLENQTFSRKKGSFGISRNESIRLKVAEKDFLLNLSKDKYQKEKQEVTFKKPELIFRKSDGTLKKSVVIFKKPEVTIEKLEANFKKPELVIKKPVMTIRKPEGNIKKPEVLQRPIVPMNIIHPTYQLKLEAPEIKIGIFTKNLNNLCNDMQNVCLKRSRSTSPFRKSEQSIQILEPSFQILESALQKSESPLQKLEPQESESDLKNVEPPSEEPEPSRKKFKTILKVPFEEEIKNEILLKTIKSLPAVEVGDDEWYHSVKEKINLESELPTDITNIAMQDFPNSQSFEACQNASGNFIFSDLSNETFTSLDSYLMNPESQSLDELNSNSEGINMDNTFGLQFPIYQTGSSQISGNDYSNADELIFENNQYLVSPVDPSETALMNSDVSPIYTELLPVFYH